MRILLVEDETALAELIAERLKKERYLVDVCEDGEEALFQALTGIYDLILLDIMLPHRNGIEILKEIRAEGIASKVIMLTAKGELEDKLLGFSEGANDYVPKPFHIDELLARINAQLRVATISKEELQFGNLILDYQVPAVKNSFTGEQIKINNKEFQLLEYFMINHSRVLSKEMIFDRVWGTDSDTLSNNLEAYLSFVRKKLKSIDANVTIKTIRNMGYRMETMDEGTE